MSLVDTFGRPIGEGKPHWQKLTELAAQVVVVLDAAHAEGYSLPSFVAPAVNNLATAAAILQGQEAAKARGEDIGVPPAIAALNPNPNPQEILKLLGLS